MMYFPSLKYSEAAVKKQIVQFRGVNYSDNAQEGEFSACENLSCRRYPYLSQRRKRVAVGDYASPTAITAWNRFIVVDGTSLLCDGTKVGTVTAGEKQFAVVNTKLVIWPDKVYLDMSTLVLHPLAASVTAAGAVFTTNTITLTGTALTSSFAVGDCITITGCTVKPANNKDVVITALTDTVITASADAFTAGTETAAVTFSRRIPALDYICESENRLWGVCSADQTIYASALGDPTNFFVYAGVSTDSYAVAVGSAGDFTGICRLSTSVCCWKSNILHKILGSYPAEYALYTYGIAGVQAGSAKSMQVINDVLYYKAPDGVYAYSGGTPSLISSAFGNVRFSQAVAGTDGQRYCVSMHDGSAWSLLVYDTRTGLWLREDDTKAVDFCLYGGSLYMLSSDGSVYALDAGTGSETVSWSAVFAPFYETAHAKKYYSTLYLRLELGAGAYVSAETRCDGGLWEKAGTVRGKSTAILPVRPRRCDKFELRLSGSGECAVLSLVRELRAGTEV